MDDTDKQVLISTLNIIKDQADYITRKCAAMESYIDALQTTEVK